MRSVDRVSTVLQGRLPDRVPVSLHNFLMCAKATGALLSEFCRNGEVMAEGQITLWKRFRHDVLLLENGTAALAEACGCAVEYLPHSAPVVLTPAIRDYSEIGKLRIPDPETTFPLNELLKATRLVSRELQGKAFIIGRGDQGPFSLAALLRGVDNFMMDLALGEELDKVFELLDFSWKVVARFALAQLAQGAQATSIGESLSGPDVISPRQYHTFAFANVRRLVETLQSQNSILAYHICGNATSIVEQMVATGAGILELDHKVDLQKTKEAAQGKTCLHGPVDPSGVIARGTPTEVREKCRQAIEVWGSGGGLILAPGCALPGETPHANVDAMMEAALTYGRY